jgi:hypothetical protein
MKKNLVACFTGMSLFLFMSIGSNAQLSFVKVETSKTNPFNETTVSKNASDNIEPSSVNHKAVKDFARNFKNANEKWYQVENQFVALFTLDNISYQVGYNKKGNKLYSIRNYGENNLPLDIRHNVKSIYYDYAITLVQEIEMPMKPLTFIVHLDGKTDIINLRISDGEMDEWQKFQKSK